MKKYKGLIIGVVILALLIGAYLIVSNMNVGEDDTASQAKANGPFDIIDETNDTITVITYSNSYGDVNFLNVSGIWSCPANPDMPVSQSFVNEMASKLTKVTATREIDTDINEADYGFDEPTLVLTIGTKGTDSHTLTVGKKNTSSGNYYLKFKDKIYMIDDSIVVATNYELNAALDTHMLPVIDPEKIKSLTVNGEEANKNGYLSLSVGIPENYKEAEKYGFDGTENKVVVKYTETSVLNDEAGNVTSEIEVEKEYSFSYVTNENSEHFIMLQDDPIIYRGVGIEALTLTESAE